MSDPVTNAEVEDVLSSIRRLVSEDKRPLQSKTRPVVSDRLVLTPALRVAEPEAEVPDESADATAQDWSEEDAAFEAAYGDGSADDAVLGKEPEADASEDDEIYSTAQTDAENPVSDKIETDLDDPALDYETDPYNFADDTDQDGEGTRASRSFDDEFRDLEEDESPVQGLDADDSAAPGQHDAQAATLSAKIEALETAIGNIADTWEPDSPGDGEYSGTEAPAMAWEDDLDQTASTARLHNLPENRGKQPDAASFFSDRGGDEHVGPDRPVTDRPGAAGDAKASTAEERPVFGDDDQVLDEEALRDLVSEIVRAELQGALGERITRNVRKLVRREIHRALTAQELE
ncbi:hypothetical protein A8B82_20165 [Sulfitobacter sp. EhC04]|uniref:hypothetical protein n=1 Tax=Sulfitobacter sp. EhC04 TaxID=1849168 RepID=UPI0007F4D31E|nr:hypothetical protein [Sulfitobacter sp. EhC04]OAN72334.1 hypothetical protein A8B82_20165 [Sulfitobacter sp. EhC04]